MNISFKLWLVILSLLVIKTGILAQVNSTSSMIQTLDNWELISSANIKNLKDIHNKKWSSDKVIPIKVPNTIFGGLVEFGQIKNPFFAANLENFDRSAYDIPWVYRTTFNLNEEAPLGNVELILEGFNYKANVWINGELIADSTYLIGPYRIINLSLQFSLLRPKDNVLVIEIFPPKEGDLTIGWVDWNPYPPDDNMGLWRPVKLKQSGDVSIKSAFVETKIDKVNFSWADLGISVDLVNHSPFDKKGKIIGHIDEISFEMNFQLDSYDQKTIQISPTTHPELYIENPEIWWPNNLGEQPLYDLNLQLFLDDELSDNYHTRFGIREVDTYINEEGHRGYTINGKKILIKGGGWVDDLFLREDEQKVRSQVQYTKHMGLNTIRLEGFWGSSKTLFDACDEEGILLMIGWSCHWEWEAYCQRPTDDWLLIRPEENEFHAQSFQDQVRWLRNHPSIFTWVYGSDMLPRPELELILTRDLDAVDKTRPRLAGCRQVSQDGSSIYTSEISGPVAVKMMGPYSYVTPNYWYEDRKYGGAYGFNTETGPGIVPTVFESVQKFTPKDKLWPVNEVWDFHTGRGHFATFDRWLAPFNERYGKATSAEDLSFRAQLSNYEALRAMFEAFTANKPAATGIIQWMLNSSFPNHLWQLYDYYLMPTGAFYGTKKANQTQTAIYNYHEKAIYASNESLKARKLTIKMQVMDLNSNLIFQKEFPIEIEAYSSQKVYQLPDSIHSEGHVYFIDLEVTENEDILSDNFYWVSKKEDVCDYDQTNWYITPNTSYADFNELNQLPMSNLEVKITSEEIEDYIVFSTEINNPSQYLAFFTELSICDQQTDENILPVFWADNYISFLPNEKRLIKAKIYKRDLGNADCYLRVKGMNINEARIDIKR